MINIDDKTGIIFKRKAYKSGGSIVMPLPKELLDYVGIQDGDELTCTAYDKNKGRFIAIWKK